MWSHARQLQRLCTPLLQATGLRSSPALAPNNSASLLQRSFHLLAVCGLRKTLSLLPQHRFASPIDVDRCVGILCNTSPSTATPALSQPSCGFKLKHVLKRRCKDCYFVVRENRLHVICKTHPRHKQLAITKHEKSTWILTHATQSPIRPY